MKFGVAALALAALAGPTLAADTKRDPPADGKLLHEFDLAEPYISYGTAEIPHYEIGGSTIVSRHGVRLTGDIQGQRGWLASSRTVVLPPAFELEIEVSVEGVGKTLFGDGMAVWFLDLDQEISEGPVFGLRDYFKGTAVLIDTYRNKRTGKVFPLAVLMQNDGTQQYDADNDGLANELAGCSLRGLHNPSTGKSSQLRMRFDGTTFSMEARINGQFKHCFQRALSLGQARRLAISASTGDLTEAHLVKSIRLWSITPARSSIGASTPQKNDKFHDASGREKRSKGGSWTWFLFKLLFLGAAATGGYKLWLQYKRKRDRETDLFKYS